MLKSIIGATCICLAVASFSANAVVLNTLNGVDYEWLEPSKTLNLSRNQVDQLLLDSSSDLYGYQYASRALVEDLFNSYVSGWHGTLGYHMTQSERDGIEMMISDFGYTAKLDLNYTSIWNTHDGVEYEWNSRIRIDALYGLSEECGGVTKSCYALFASKYLNDTLIASFISPYAGADASAPTPTDLGIYQSDEYVGSFLVRETVVPVPAAVWLFGSGLISLIGLARRKNHS